VPRRSYAAAPTWCGGHLALPVLAAALTTLAAAAPARAGAVRAARPAVATVALTQAAASGQKLTVRGRATLRPDSASARRRTRIAFTLTDATRRRERFAAALGAKGAFAVTRTTKLSGRLTLVAQATIGGRASGKAARRALTVTVRSRGTTKPAPGPAAPGPATTPTPVPDDAVKLVGLFRFDEGVSNPDGSHRGTYFRMFIPRGLQWPFSNENSRSRDKTFTLLRPGTDSGLRTDAYQTPASPLYDGSGVLTKSIVQRELFFGAYFTVFTQSSDAATGATAGLPTPIPEIYAKDGRLTGQTTAWTANWNGAPLFNQGSPKPDGSLPGFTQPVTGTYDPVTRHFVIEWTSQIVGGGFNDYSGYWHLEGTFVPAG
jgi:hypothetical protein